MYIPDAEKAYRLVEVTNLDKTPKTDSLAFYEERLGCVGKLKLSPDAAPGKSCLWVQFYRDARGRRTNLQLQTSPLWEMTCSDGILQATTFRSLYYFEETTLPSPVYLQEKNLVELYLTRTGNDFCEGYWYDGDGTPHPLHCITHLGMVADSYLLQADGFGFICRYFTSLQGISLYRSLHSRDVEYAAYLVHNECDRPLQIRFASREESFVVPAGETLRVPNLDTQK